MGQPVYGSREHVDNLKAVIGRLRKQVNELEASHTLASLLTPSEAQDVESLLVEIALSLRKRPYLLMAVNKLRRALRERAKEGE